MASPSSEPSLAPLEGRRFSFYPTIRNIEHNEWTLARETWSEILVSNVRSGLELWIPRTYISGISGTDLPVLIVGLHRELEFKAGAVWPYRPRVIEIPRRVAGSGRKPEAAVGAPVAGPGSPAESHVGRLVAWALAFGLAVCLMAVIVVFEGVPNPLELLFRPDTSTADQRYLSLTGTDNHYDVIEKIGPPESEKWISREDAEIQFQVLLYPARSYALAMMGPSREEARYIGALHLPSRRTLDAVKLSGGGSTASMLRNLPDF